MANHVIPLLAINADIALVRGDLRNEFALVRSDLRNAVTELKVWMIAAPLAVVTFADAILFAALRHYDGRG
jgi:hypothetical protein